MAQGRTTDHYEFEHMVLGGCGSERVGGREGGKEEGREGGREEGRRARGRQ